MYSLVLSCTHHGKIPAAKSGFVCFADKIGFVFAFLVFYLFSIYLCRLFLYRRNPSGQSLHRKSRSWAKASEAGNLGRYIAGRVSRRCDCECAQTGAFLAATGAVCGAAAAWYLRTTSCRRVKLIYWLVGLFTCENPVMSVSQFCNETKAAHLFERCV